MTQAAQLAQYGANNVGLSFKNRIINGGFDIWQRGTTVTGVGIDTFGPDRFKQWAQDGSETGRATWSQSTDVPTGQGFQYSSKLAVTTAQASFTASQGYAFEQRIEANNVYDLAFGTSGAASTTVSFWAKTTKAGTYTVAVLNNGSAATNVYKQTVSLTSTWTKYQITIPGDTSLATTATSNGQGMALSIMLSNGATSTATTSWVTYSLANRTATGQVNFYDSTSNELYVTGVQLEKGTVATSFDVLSYTTEFQLCQRYFSRVVGASSSLALFMRQNAVGSGNSTSLIYTFKATMRAAPTWTRLGTWTVFQCQQPTANMTSPEYATIVADSTASGDSYAYAAGPTTGFDVSAEL
jgi:hypothetical protein